MALRGAVQLLRLTPVDAKDELEKVWSDMYRKLQDWMRDLSEAEINNFLNQKVSESSAKQMETTLGLLYGILTSGDFDNSQMFFKYMTFSVRDGYAGCVSQLKRLIHEKYSKLHDTPRERLVWLVAELVKLQVSGSDALCIGLIRYLVTGDLSARNLWLLQQLCDTFSAQKPWLAKNEKLLCTVVYSFQVMLLDLVMYRNKVGEPGIQLANTVTTFLIGLIRENFPLVITIGRDFGRMVFDLKSFGVTEFDQLWHDMLNDPKKLDSSGSRYTSSMQIFAAPTRARFLLSRLTPDMERQMYFMMTHVKMGNQRRYQHWFAQKHFVTRESDSLIPDLVRYTCCVYHPPHNVIAANMTPRWAILGWLLKSVKSKNGFERTKNAMIFDWLCFNPSMDSIMNIEPAMLLMLHSIGKYTDVTQTVLASLITWKDAKDPSKQTYILPNDRIAENVRVGMKLLVEKGVVGSLTPLAECQTLDVKLRDSLKKQFPQYCAISQKQAAGGSSGTLPVTGGIPSPSPPSPHDFGKQSVSKSPSSPTSPRKPIPGNEPFGSSPAPPVGALASSKSQAAAAAKGGQRAATSDRPKPIDTRKELSEAPEISTQITEGGSRIKERLKMEQQPSAQTVMGASSLSSVMVQTSTPTTPSGSDPQLFKLFGHHLRQFEGCTSFLTGDMDDDSDDDFFEKAVESLRNILDTFEKDENLGVDRMEEDQITQKLAHWIIRCLSHEFDASKKSEESYILQTIVSADKTIVYHLFDRIFSSIESALLNSHRAASVSARGRRVSTIGSVKYKLPRTLKRSRDRFAALLKHACAVEPSLGYRAFCYCISKSSVLVSDIREELADQLKDYRHLVSSMSAVDNDEAVSAKKSAKNNGDDDNDDDDTDSDDDGTPIPPAKRHFLFYEYVCQLRRRMGTNMLSFFVKDMENCIVDNPKLMLVLLPILSRSFSTYTRSQQFVSVLLSNLMPDELYDLLSMVSVGRVQILHPISMKELTQLADASLDWDHFEQSAFWDLVLAELAYELFKISADEDVDERVVAASTACNFQDFVMQVLELKKLDVRKNRHFLSKMQQFFTQHYQSSDDMNFEFFKFLVTRPPQIFGSFPAHFLLHWMASEPSTHDTSSRGHQAAFRKHINRLLKEIYHEATSSEETEQELIKTAQHIIINLWHVKCGENDVISVMKSKSIIANLKRLKDGEIMRSADDGLRKMFCVLVEKDINWQKLEQENDDDAEDSEEEDEEDASSNDPSRAPKRKRSRSPVHDAGASEEEDEEDNDVDMFHDNDDSESSDDDDIILDVEDDDDEKDDDDEEGELVSRTRRRAKKQRV